MQLDIHQWILGMWMALGVFWGILWLVGAASGKRATRVQSQGSRLVHLALMAAAFWLLFASNPQFASISWTIFPDVPLVRASGLVLTCAGLGFTVWARVLLGRNWSAFVTIKQGHTLVRRGPYRWVRHPIYSGLLLAMLGTAISFGEFRGLVGLALGLVGFWLKARLEETFLMEQFGQEYVQYRKEVKALIPSVL